MKQWYISKTVWFGIIQTLIGVGLLLADFFGAGNFTAQAVTLLIVGALTVVLRVWFTDTAIAK